MVEYILFKHPSLKFRKEDFGGIIKTQEGLYLLDKQAFKLLNKIDNEKTYSKLTKDKDSKEVIDELLKMRAVLRIVKNKAEKIKEELSRTLD